MACAQASLVPTEIDKIMRVFCARALTATEERTEPEAESKAEAVASKRAILSTQKQPEWHHIIYTVNLLWYILIELETRPEYKQTDRMCN